MPFTGAYSITQGNDPSSFILTDTSDYTDEPQATFSGRRIFLYKTDGTTLVPSGTTTDYIDFPYSAGDFIEIDVLNQDYSLDILVEWISLAPQPGSVYSLEVVYTFLEYTNLFIYGVIQTMRSNPLVINDTNFYTALMQIYVEKKNAEQANRYQDQDNAQQSIERAKYFIDNSQFFF